MPDEFNVADRAPFPSEKRNLTSKRTRSTQLLLAIEEAKKLGFDATKKALIEMLRLHEQSC